MRTVRYDPDLGLEAYHFSRVIQIFPGHFHEYYTLVSSGAPAHVCRGIDCCRRRAICFFEPGDVYSCSPVTTVAWITASQCRRKRRWPGMSGNHWGGVSPGSGNIMVPGWNFDRAFAFSSTDR